MGKVKVIVINGYSRSGKDSFVDAVRKKIPKCYQHSTIDTVRYALEEYGMLPYGKKGEAERKFLQTVKKAWIEYNDGPTKEVIKHVLNLEKQYLFANNVDRILLFVHVREATEIYKLVQFFEDNCITVKVTRPNIKPQSGDEEVHKRHYDYEVYNDADIDDLDTLADYFLEFLNERR